MVSKKNILVSINKSNIKSEVPKQIKVKVPPSKSHTIRALYIASLAEGESAISNPLISEDALSACKVCKAFGAEISENQNGYIVHGVKGQPRVPEDVVDVGNSGTTLRLGLSVAALVEEGYTVFTGDSQIRRRPVEPLVKALNKLGAKAFSTRNNGMAPVVVKGRMVGGKTEIDAYTSQFLSSLLLSCPLLEKDTEIEVVRLNEVPYVHMTLWWLDRQGIRYECDDKLRKIYIYGGQSYKNFEAAIPGDFSSATFFMVLAAISGTEVVLENLDMTDPQGDKMVLSVLESMGAKVRYTTDSVIIKGNGLKGTEIDMNSIPDALPAMAVAGCFAEGETKLVNVPQARLKETDRISVMHNELKKMGADIEELPDSLLIRKSKLKGCKVNGHYDHRVVMALTVAGLNAEGTTEITTAEAVNVTYPEFFDTLMGWGYDISIESEEC